MVNIRIIRDINSLPTDPLQPIEKILIYENSWKFLAKNDLRFRILLSDWYVGPQEQWAIQLFCNSIDLRDDVYCLV